MVPTREEVSLEVIANVMVAREIYTDDIRKQLINDYRSLQEQEKKAYDKLTGAGENDDSRLLIEKKQNLSKKVMAFEDEHKLISKIVNYSL